jgi:hypothetical protein
MANSIDHSNAVHRTCAPVDEVADQNVDEARVMREAEASGHEQNRRKSITETANASITRSTRSLSG